MSYCWGYTSFADCVKARNATPSSLAWSFYGSIPKIVVSSPMMVKRQMREVRRSLNRVSKAKVLPRQRVPRQKEESPWLQSFMTALYQGGVTLRGRVVHRDSPMHKILRAQRAFKAQWVVEHQPKKRVIPLPTVSPTLTGKIWSRPAAPKADRWDRCSASSDKAQEGSYQEEWVLVRSVTLLAKLRAFIKALEYRRTGCVSGEFGRKLREVFYRNKDLIAALREEVRKSVKRPIVHPEMETGDAHGKGEVKDETSQNVVLQTHAIDSATTPPILNTISMRQWAGDDVETDYSALYNRWSCVRTVQWSGTVVQGKSLVACDLPYDLFSSEDKKNDCGLNTPAHAPFELYRYWHGDMDIRIQVNGNKFQQGQLQCSWFYLPSIDSQFSLRDNIYSCSYTDHCLIDAAESNDAILHIPYRSFRPRLPTKYRKDMGSPMLMGRLKIMVMNPLLLGQGQTSEASVSIYIRFVNSSFSGMVNRDVGSLSAEMFPITAAAAMQYLYNQYSDKNRDNPPVQQSVIQNVPQTAQSFCLANNVSEPIQALRLDAHGQTPHPEGQTDEMMISHVTSVFGYVKTISWGNESSGTKLATFDASPMFSLDQYRKTVLESNDCYYMPPVAVISNLFAYWRGGLELRIDVVATQFHTGRFLVAYVPGHLGDINICQARGSHYQVFDLRESRQFVMKIPYIADRPWWPRRYDAGTFNEEQQPPGRIHIFVCNQLVAMPNVSTTVALNCYWRGGDNLEFSIPVQPSIGLSFNPKSNKITHNDAWARDGYYPYYVGSWASFQGGTRPILRYGAVTQHIAQFNRLKYDYIYTPPNSYKNELTYLGADKAWYRGKVFIPVDVGDGYGYIYLAVCSSKTEARDVWTVMVDGKRQMRPSPDFSHLVNLGDTSSNAWLPTSYGNMLLAGSDNTSLLNETLEDYLLPEIGEANKGVSSVQVLPPSSDTNSGQFTFGEVFNDLKTLCRRYEVYSSHIVTLTKNTKIGIVHIRLPLLIQGLDFKLENNPIRNNLRDGVIATVASGYRFFRGGLRIRIVVNTPGIVGMWVEHRPERRLYKLEPQTIVSHNIDDLYNFGYAMGYQNTFINNVLTLEIPFYQPGSLGLLQRPYLDKTEITSHISLGDLMIGFHCEMPGDTKTLNLDVATFYCLADDCRFIQFQGFPPMLMTKDIAFDKTKVNVEDSVNKASTSKIVVHPEMNYGVVHPEGLLDKMKMEVVHSVKSEIPQSIVTGEANNDVSSSPFYTSSTFYQGITVVITQVMHILVGNPIYNGIVALVSLLTHLGIVCFTNFNTLILSIKKLFSSWGVSTEQSIEADVRGEGFFDSLESKDYAVIVGTCLSGMCAAGKVADMKINSIAGFSKILSSGLSELTRGGFFIIRFFENVFELVSKLAIYIRNKCNPKELLQYIRANNSEIVKVWADEASVLLHPDNEEKILTYPSWFERLEIAYNVGATLNAAATCSSRDDNNVRLNATAIMTIQTRLHTLRAKAAALGLVGASRVEPWCIWVHGEAGIGKSHLTSKISSACLDAANVPRHGDYIYVHAAKNNFMDGLKNQPVFLFDDYACVNEPDNDTHSTFMRLNSCAVFIPNQAHLEDKGKRYAPKIVYVNANKGYINDAAFADRDAFHRRRHLLIEASVKANHLAAHIVVRDQEAYEVSSQKIVDALQFRIAHNPMDAQTSYSNWMNFDEMLSIATKNFTKHNDRAIAMYLKRVQEMTYNTPDVDPFIPLSVSIHDIAERLQKGTLNNNVQTPLQKYMRALDLKTRAATNPSTPVEPVPSTSGVQPEMGKFKEATKYIADKILDATNSPPAPVVANTPVIPDTSVPPPPLYKGRSSLDNRVRFKETPKLNSNVHIVDRVALVNGRIAKRSNPFKTSYSVIPNMPNHIYNKNIFDVKAHNDKYPNCVHSYINLREATFDGITKAFYTSNYVPISNCPCKNACVMSNVNDKKAMLSELVSTTYAWNVFYSTILEKLEDDALKTFWDFEGTKNPFAEAFKALLTPPPKTLVRRGWDVIVDFLCNHIKVLLGTIGMVVIGLAAYKYSGKVKKATNSVSNFIIERYADLKAKFTNSHKDMTREEITEYIKLRDEIQSSGDTNKVLKIGKTTGITPKVILSGEISTPVQLQNLNGIITTAHKNTFFMVIEGTHPNCGTRVRDVGRCVGLVGNTALIPYHYRLRIDSLKDVNITVHRLFSTVQIYPQQLKWSRLQNCELSVVTLPHVVGYFKDIRKWFAPANVIQTQLSSKLYFLEIGQDFRHELEALDIDVSSEMTMENEGRTDVLVDVITYNKHANGKCGSLLIDPTGRPCIVGMHVAGGGGVGVAEPIVSETFAKVPGYNIADCPEKIISSDPSRVVLTSNFIPICVTKPELAHVERGVSEIVPSIISGVFPITTSPAPLSNKDPRVEGSPMVSGVEKHGKPIIGFDRKDLKHAAEDYKNLLFTFLRPLRAFSGRVPLPIVLNGIAGMKEYKSMTYSTSEGFPFVTFRPYGACNKRWLFHFENDKVTQIHEQLKQVLDMKQQQREDGVIPFTVFTDCLKDSRILTEKCTVPGKTRIFSISPVDFSIHFREYFLDFIASFMRNRIKTEHAIGIACDSTEWTVLGRKITSLGEYILDGDYANFGPGLDLDCVAALCEIIIEWYEKYTICTKLDSQVRRILFYELMHSIHLCFNLLYRTICGCPSGSPATVIINSGVNSLYIRLAWRHIFRNDPFLRTMDRFRRYVAFVTYGDDILLNVHPDVILKFNNFTIQQFFKEHNLGYTDAKKGSSILPYSTFSEVTFLKRGFGLHPFRQHLLLAKLDKRFLTDIANWIVRSPDAISQSREASVMCCMQAFGHGIEYFNYIRNALIEAWREVQYPISFRTWDYFDELFIKEKDLLSGCDISAENALSLTDCDFSSLLVTN